jgi:large subunit ribosomal protein L9
MDVILLQDVARVGRAGELCKVAPGYARNHLFPKGLAVLATEGAIKQLEQTQAVEAKRQKQLEEEARELASEIDGLTLTIHAKTGEKDRLYGSVTSSDIAEALEKETGRSIDRRKLELQEPIRQLGIYTVPVRLLPDQTASFRVDVVGEGEGAEDEEPATDERD